MEEKGDLKPVNELVRLFVQWEWVNGHWVQIREVLGE